MASTAKHDWPMVPLLETADDVTRGHKKVPKSAYEEVGSTPIVDQSMDFICGYTDEVPTLVSPPYIVFGDHTRELKYIDFPFVPGADGVKVLKPAEGIAPKFLYFYLKAHPVQELGYSRHFKLLKELAVPLPPLDEQRRIAAILDEARGQRDKYAGAGTLLGTMTSNWLSLRSQSIPRMKLSELGTFRGGMTPSKKNSEYWGGDVPWFTTKDLKFAEVYESEDRITHRALDETSASLIGEPSIAFSLRGMSLAHRLPMSCIPGEVTVNQDLKAFVPNQSKDRDVLFYLVKLREKELLSKVSSSAHGTKKLDFRHLNELEVPDPSGEFGSEVRRVLEQIRDMQEQIRRRQETSMTLFQALSTRAFQGEL
ncbi:restriction endonuclease subunit S [Corynebacterium sp. c25Ua_89]|uniref:restriction endonuclease subunit S n=1 Tax=Corynebacterium sp. c25Ua_89 TaxID=3032356 RepID=UPI0039C42520